MLQDLFIGSAPNDKTGTPARQAGQMINENFAYLNSRITTIQSPDAVLKRGNIETSVLNVHVDADAFEWRIAQVEFLDNPVYDVVLDAATDGYYRKDVLLGNNTGGYNIFKGDEDPTSATEPNLFPNGTIKLGVIDVYGAVITGSIVADDFELIVNKQNSLIVDGTGVKYPTIDIINKYINYTTLEAFGAIGDGVTNDATAIQNAVNSGKIIRLGNKTYLSNSTITINSATTIVGSGKASSIKTTSNLPVFYFQSSFINFDSFKIEGNGRGSVTPYVSIRPLQDGIKMNGAFYGNYIKNITFLNLGGSGIYGSDNQNGISSNVNTSAIVSNCFFLGNLFGINYDTLFEYNLTGSCLFKDNETGLKITGGNNSIIGGHVINNRTGISLTSGSNDSHSVATGVTINHNTDFAIKALNVVNGFTFSNCAVFFGVISLSGTTGITIDGGLAKWDSNLVLTNTTNTTIQNVKFISTPAATSSGNVNLRYFNNSYPSTTPAGMQESISGLTNTNIFDINATSAANNLIRMRLNFASRFLIGSDAGIFGGNDGDFNTFITGDNNWIVSTNGVKRIFVDGSGVFKINNLAGLGVRRVDVDASGKLVATEPAQTILTSSAILDFPNTAAGTSNDLTITVTGAAIGDVVSLGVPYESVEPNTIYTAYVSAANTVNVRFGNLELLTARNPASGSFKVKVFK